jgi:hypothetical protein
MRRRNMEISLPESLAVQPPAPIFIGVVALTVAGASAAATVAGGVVVPTVVLPLVVVLTTVTVVGPGFALTTTASPIPFIVAVTEGPVVLLP